MGELPYIDKVGRTYTYGEFFPPDLSPFAYNETIATESFPMSKEKAISQGYRWNEREKNTYSATIGAEELPDNIKDIKGNLVNEIIECAHKGKCEESCVEVFRFLPKEIAFYRKQELPLPRLCWRCRDAARLEQRGPMKFWVRSCACAGEHSKNNVYKNETKHFHGAKVCPNDFKTSYASERPEIVYCEVCYNSEVA